MRPFLLALLASLALVAAEPPAPSQPTGKGREERSKSGVRAWPFWDGSESIEHYTRRAGLEPTKALDLGNGVKLELVLIPASWFTMGTPEPPPIDVGGFQGEIFIGQAVCATSVAVLLVFLSVVVIRAIRQRSRLQYSLGRFVAMILAAGVGVLSGMHWWNTVRRFEEAKAAHETLSARIKDSYEWEKPAHEVALTKPFYMGKFEVTQEQYQQVSGTNPSQFRGPDFPVEGVSWLDAVEFCKKASGKTGSSLRLPTGAQWEHACRAGTETTYYTGDLEADLDRAGWYRKNSNSSTHPVGQKAPNAWGLCDTHGNVREWCADWHALYRAGVAVDPRGPEDSAGRVLRGGSWDSPYWFCRSASRERFSPEVRGHELGFRVVVDVPMTP